MLTAEQIISHYRLEALDQEGGFFRQVWRSELRVDNASLGAGYPVCGDRPMGTLIYFLITSASFSAMHRLPTAEHWFYHAGDSAEMLLLHEGGHGEVRTLGLDLLAGQEPQVTTPAGSWQGRDSSTRDSAISLEAVRWCTGFDWTDFELGDRAVLSAAYPDFQDEIEARTRSFSVEGNR